MTSVSSSGLRTGPAHTAGMVGAVLVSLGLMGGAMEGEDMEPLFGRTFFSSVVGSALGYIGVQKLMRGRGYGGDDAGPDAIFAAVMGAGMAVGGWIGHKITCGVNAAGSFPCRLMELAGMIAGMVGTVKLMQPAS